MSYDFNDAADEAAKLRKDQWQPEYYAFFNADQAWHLIGEEVECSDEGVYWDIVHLTAIGKDIEFPFIVNGLGYYRYIRTIQPKPTKQTEEKEACGICRFWGYSDRGVAVCKKGPVQPRRYSDDWCGEFNRRWE